jgi:hypothetical protein
MLVGYFRAETPIQRMFAIDIFNSVIISLPGPFVFPAMLLITKLNYDIRFFPTRAEKVAFANGGPANHIFIPMRHTSNTAEGSCVSIWQNQK